MDIVVELPDPHTLHDDEGEDQDAGDDAGHSENRMPVSAVGATGATTSPGATTCGLDIVRPVIPPTQLPNPSRQRAPLVTRAGVISPCPTPTIGIQSVCSLHYV